MQLSELKKRMKGVSVVQATPFNADGSLDLEGMRANTRWLAEYAAGKDFIFTPVGSTGEYYAMSDEECQAVIKMVVEETKGRAVVMVGAGRAGTPESIKMCQYAQSVGADGAQVVIPFYHIPKEEGMYLHFKQVAESVDENFGIMVYNNPDVSGSWVKPSLMKKLSKIPNIIAVKENTSDVASYYAMQRALDPEDMVVLCGMAELLFSFEAVYGCPGLVSGIANFAPDLTYSIYESAIARDFDTLAGIVNSRIGPYSDFKKKVSESHGPHTGAPGTRDPSAGYMEIGSLKAAMDIVGLRGGEPRLPLVALSKEEKAELRSLLEALRIAN